MARAGCLALFLAAALASCSAAPSPSAALPPLEKLVPRSNFPSARHPPASALTLAEQAAALNLTPPPRTVLGPRRGPAGPADAVGGAQKYPFGLASPLSPERTKERRPDTTPAKDNPAKVNALAANPSTANLNDDVTDPTRLPTDVVPVRYTVKVAPEIIKGTYYGSTDIYLNVVKATDRITLHAASSLNIPQVEILRYSAGSGYLGFGNNATLLQASDNVGSEQRVVQLTAALKPGKHYLLRFPVFAADLRDDLKGFYLSTYKDANGHTVLLATTQFEPPAARFAFPCFDEPAFKARFQIIIEHDRSLTAVSNMPIVSQTNPTLTTTQTVFDETLPMSTYLLAWVVSDYSAVGNKDDGSFKTWGRSNALDARSAHLSQRVGPAALDKLKDFTGIPYALPKLDQFSIPDFEAGAMENWGLVTYREEYLLENSRTPIRIREFIATTVCHELGHQWTGNLVTLDWWSNTWLNEAFATYFESVICDQLIPEWKLMDKYVTDNVHVGIVNDVIPGQVAMSSPALTSAAIENKFDRISYKKGGAVLRMFEHILGTDVWKKALHRYLSVNAFKNGSPDRLFKAMDAEAKTAGSPLPKNVSFAAMAKTWTEQAGVPVVTADRLYAKNAVVLTQKQFYYAAPEDPDYVGNFWYIPIPEPVYRKTNKTGASWSLEDAPESKRWLTPASPSMTRDLDAASSDWIVVNPKQIGYYMVNYDETNWNMLITALKSTPAAFDASTRTQLVHDALALARGGLLSYTVALPFLQVLKDESEAAPWRAGIEALTFLSDRLTTTAAGYALQAFIGSITEKPYKDLGFLDEQVEPDTTNEFSRDEQRYLRFYIASYACNAGNQRCSEDAVKGLTKHIGEGSNGELQADVRDTGMCFGVRNSADLFLKVVQKWKDWDAEDAEGEEPQSVYAAAISCTKDHRLLGSILDDILDGKLKKSPADFQELVNKIISRWDNHNFLLDYFKKNHLKISSFTQNNFWFNLLLALIGDIRTTEEYTALEASTKEILQSHKITPTAQKEVELRFAAAKKDLAWYEKHYATVSEWLFAVTGLHPQAPTELPAPTNPTQRPTPPPSQPSTSTAKPSSAPRVQVANLLILLVAALFPVVLCVKN